ncbi:MAG: hypothetical protein AAF917_09745, partial [Pseudomonadota bacterium]
MNSSLTGYRQTPNYVETRVGERGANSGVSGNWNPLVADIEASNIDTDPFFKNPANGDLSLVDCSPAIDAGNKRFQPLTEDLAG